MDLLVMEEQVFMGGNQRGNIQCNRDQLVYLKSPRTLNSQQMKMMTRKATIQKVSGVAFTGRRWEVSIPGLFLP